MKHRGPFNAVEIFVSEPEKQTWKQADHSRVLRSVREGPGLDDVLNWLSLSATKCPERMEAVAVKKTHYVKEQYPLDE